MKRKIDINNGHYVSPTRSSSSSSSSSYSLHSYFYLSTSSSSVISVESSCVPPETEETVDSPEKTVLVGCPRCHVYVMSVEVDPKCPRCKSTALLDFLKEEEANYGKNN